MKEITISFGNEIELTKNKNTQKRVWIKLATSFRENQLKQLKGAALSVFICLGLHANGQGYCWPSNETIMEETRYDINTILRTKKKLEKQKYIYREQQHKKGAKYSVCLYRIFRSIEKGCGLPFHQNSVTADTLKRGNGFENNQSLEAFNDESCVPESGTENTEEVEPLFKKNIYSIFDHWNSKGKKNVTVHRHIKDFAPTIKTALENYSEKEIKESIDSQRFKAREYLEPTKDFLEKEYELGFVKRGRQYFAYYPFHRENRRFV